MNALTSNTLVSKFSKALVALTLIVASSAAHATSSTWNHHYGAKFHFTKEAYGKKVSQVIAHTGIYVREKGYMTGGQVVWKWLSVQDVKLEDKGDHFFGKTLLQATTHSNSGGGEEVQGPIVQYWVWFEDGTSLITEEFLHPGHAYRVYVHSPERELRLKELLQKLEDTQDASETSFEGLEDYLA